MATSSNATSSDSSIAGVEPVAAGVVILILCVITIIGNTLLIASIWKLKRRRTNHNFHPVLLTIGMFSCLELSFAIIPELIFSISFLSDKWELESSQGLCNFTGWFAFTTKTTCAFIAAILLFERYVVICKPNSTKLGGFEQSHVYWAFRVIFVAGVLATVPLFYGSGVTSTGGSLCHINYTLKTNASFGYTAFLCFCAYAILLLVLFCLISIFCQLNNDTQKHQNSHEPELHESPAASSDVQNPNTRYYTLPTNKRSGTPLSPSKYALDHSPYLETVQKDAKVQNNLITRMTLFLTCWYWICVLPYLVSRIQCIMIFTSTP